MTNKNIFEWISQASVCKTRFIIKLWFQLNFQSLIFTKNYEKSLRLHHLKLQVPTACELNLFRICPKSGLFIYTRSLHVTIMSFLRAFVCINTSDSVSNIAVFTFARKCIRLVCTVSICITKTVSLNSIWSEFKIILLVDDFLYSLCYTDFWWDFFPY